MNILILVLQSGFTGSTLLSTCDVTKVLFDKKSELISPMDDCMHTHLLSYSYSLISLIIVSQSDIS